MKSHAVLIIAAVFICFAAFGAQSGVFAQAQGYDISSGGQPTISGALNGSVSGSNSPLQNLTVSINFGEVSAANPNQIVKVVVPVAIRSRQPYQVSVSMTGSGNTDPRAIQLTDIGYGNNNMRPLGSKAQICSTGSHVFSAPFNNDPSTSATINSSGRAAYPSTIANITSSTVILTGPKLTQGTSNSRATDDGWVFDAVFVITPQFFSSGSSVATLTFTIAPGPNVQC
jgi:hypothetical protein